MKNKATLYLIDGSSIAYRAYFATIRSALSTTRGRATGASYAFTNSLLKLLREQQPDYVALVFDAPEKTFRHEIYPEYKATREAMPDELVTQLPDIRRISEAMNLNILIHPGYEADDVIATLAVKGQQDDLQTYIVSGDKDLMQVLNEDIYMYKPATGKKDAEVIDVPGVYDKWGIKPQQIPDFLALIGDKSDNIPGVKGIGPAKAKPLLQQFGTIENIYDNLAQIESERVRQLLEGHREQALFSKELATVKKDVPMETELEEFRFEDVDADQLLPIFKELEFHSLVKEFNPHTARQKQVKNYCRICSLPELESLLADLTQVALLSLDLETTSLRPMQAEIVGVSLSWEPHQGVYIPLKVPPEQRDQYPDVDGERFLTALKPVIENPDLPKCGQNLKYDMLILRRYGIELQGLEFDTMLAAFLLQPDERVYRLGRLSQQYLHYPMQPIEELIGKGRHQITMDQVPVEKVTFYAAEDADVALQLTPIFIQQLQDKGTYDVYRHIEMPLLPVLMQLEQNGVYLQTAYLEQMSSELSKEIMALSEKIYTTAGTEFNINSPKQLGMVLFDKLELPAGRKRSTAEKVLEKLKSEHPLPELILEYRSLTKLKNTYLDALPQLVNPETGRIHSSFNQTVAATGRLSSSDPNFQNIPVRTPIGRQIRKAFVTQKEGWQILAADYSQIELRIMAHLSRDPQLLQAFREDADIHTRTAALVYKVAEDQVTSAMRRSAKVVNFGIMYGAGAYRMSNELHIPVHEARQLIETYFKTYPGINAYIMQTLEQAREANYVKTLAGRLRYTYDINSDNHNVREAAKRAAINMPIQGTAADMIKIAMINIHKHLIQESWQAMMILQVHDELLFEVPETEIPQLQELVVYEMEQALPLDIPIKVDVGIGNSWYEAH